LILDGEKRRSGQPWTACEESEIMWDSSNCSVADITDRRMDTLRDTLRDYNHAEVIAALGTSDLLEAIGVDRMLDYCEAVALGPVSPDRQFVRARCVAIANRIDGG
jgi:hypothetical protein